MTIVWRLGDKIIRTVLCCIVYDTNVHNDTHTHTHTHTREQFLNLLVCKFFLKFTLLTYHLCFYVRLDQFVSVLLAFCIGFSFFSTMPRDWLGRATLTLK